MVSAASSSLVPGFSPAIVHSFFAVIGFDAGVISDVKYDPHLTE